MIGISYHSGGMVSKPLPWVIEHLGTIGYDAIEIVCGPEAHIRTGEALGPQIESTERLLARYNLRVSAINPYTMPCLVNLAKEDRDKAIGFWSLLMDIAVALHAPTVNFLPGWLADGDTEAWKLLIEVLKALTPIAAQKGLDLAIHNHEAMIVDSPDKCLLLIEQVGAPNLKVLCDITNFYILGGDIAQAVQRVGPHIVHCHLKGVVGKYPYNRFVVAGEQEDDLTPAGFDAFATALATVGYDRYISSEGFDWQRPDKAEIAHAMMSTRLRALGLRP